MSISLFEEVKAPHRHPLSVILKDSSDQTSTQTIHLEHGSLVTRVLFTQEAVSVFILLRRRDVSDIDSIYEFQNCQLITKVLKIDHYYAIGANPQHRGSQGNALYRIVSFHRTRKVFIWKKIGGRFKMRADIQPQTVSVSGIPAWLKLRFFRFDKDAT